MYGRLPDYDGLQWYDLGDGTDLSQIDGEIYAIRRNPSRGTLNTISYGEIQEELARGPEILTGVIKKGEFEQGRMFGWRWGGWGGFAKILIANALIELEEAGIVDSGDYAAFLHIRDAYSRFHVAVFAGREEKGGETAEMALWRRFRIG